MTSSNQHVSIDHFYGTSDLATYTFYVKSSDSFDDFYISVFRNDNMQLATYHYEDDYRIGTSETHEAQATEQANRLVANQLKNALAEFQQTLDSSNILIPLSSVRDFVLLSFDGKRPAYFAEIDATVKDTFDFNELIHMPSIHTELISKTDFFRYRDSGIEKEISKADNYIYSASTNICLPITIFHELATVSTNRINASDRFRTYFEVGGNKITASSFFDSDITENLRETKISKRMNSFEGLLD